MIAGSVTAELPAERVPLNEQQRRDVGLTQPGVTLCCASASGPVFIDMARDRSQVWFVHQDARAVLASFEKELQRVHANARQASDLPHYETSDRRVRFYLVDLGSGRGAQVEVGYPAPGQERADNDLFLVRVFALGVSDPAMLRPPAAASVGNAKKKGWF